MKAEHEAVSSRRAVGVKQAEIRPSRYIETMVLHKERREREQLAAWEKMEKKDRQREVATGQASAEAEAFITESYRRQLEITGQDVLAI
jgi:hypothetical protein